MGRKALGALGAVAALLCVSGAASAKVTLLVDSGWSGIYRAGRWAPVYVTASDDSARPGRAVLLEIVAPHDNLLAMRIHQGITIGPEPTTFVLHMPLTRDLYDTVAILRDARSGTKLAEQTFDPNANAGNRFGPGWFPGSGQEEILIGVGGRGKALGLIEGTFEEKAESGPPPARDTSRSTTVKVGYLPAKWLPQAVVGYEGLDVLALNAPDLVNMPSAAQQAMADWVRGGGRLLMWMGEGLSPEQSPIVKVLPCTIGEVEMVKISLGDTKALGLAARVENVTGRKLEGRGGARKAPVLRDKAAVWLGRAGLGSVAVLSIDATQLVFDDQQAAWRFWRPILWQVLKRKEGEPTEGGGRYGGYVSTDDGIQAAAMEVVADRLGDVPGVGRFDFSYIALVMIGMMLVVGPVDWLVLKTLGRQPWTWATTGGWIAVVTLGGLYVGRVFKSGELHFRTVRVIEQAGEEVVGATDVAGIYSPRTQVYELECPRGSWWEPANLDPAGWMRPRQRLPTEVRMAQDSRGNRPLGMVVNVWNLRFMQGEAGDAKAERPALRASLKRQRTGASGQERITGTITNLSSATLYNVYIRTHRGAAFVRQAASAKVPRPPDDPIKPGETVSVDVQTDVRDDARAEPERVRTYYPGRGSMPRPRDESALAFLSVCDVKAARSRAINKALEEESLACVYAEGEVPAPAVKLGRRTGGEAIERHWQVVRALVEMK